MKLELGKTTCSRHDVKLAYLILSHDIKSDVT